MTDKENIEYWKKRCEAAEKLLNYSDIKPDDNDRQLTKLYCHWIGFKYGQK